ncbi:uncharacterized protein CLUP02_03686 [Colletotrichum lupini]|uniref:Uncharacterized protein n=1 Tax=Colletotrichum lupini TaxID=145971 RepID=A0A9Q8SJA9_9PEZI|nr:uncharacterized protein CLUP02_03686 [Colletotrichum lupini]UQC78210.1 hypothetical protein CLUP02_03686 [Colletotrichum lupini]
MGEIASVLSEMCLKSARSHEANVAQCEVPTTLVVKCLDLEEEGRVALRGDKVIIRKLLKVAEPDAASLTKIHILAMECSCNAKTFNGKLNGSRQGFHEMLVSNFELQSIKQPNIQGRVRATQLMTNGLLLLEPQNGLPPRGAWTALSRSPGGHRANVVNRAASTRHTLCRAKKSVYVVGSSTRDNDTSHTFLHGPAGCQSRWLAACRRLRAIRTLRLAILTAFPLGNP